ncbi:two-component system KDP operon response regulator KdpE [Nocardioides marinisabuli]|uniref:Two-component system KDP operon response regulator KdpE n=1 Tax=Nocardioides marinisabuli TaxID=419476 RepID=A0A7Y9F4C7_9ACTN|nr:response regulator transcription factor [Nocardioides marinisabuli]NYD59223.1 two-component system KDP operon response regulator KdpE [Nocardioides marinisabuli]
MAKVLVVDDDPALRQALRGALGRVGFEVVVAPDARGGLDLLTTARPDAVVLDLGLPDAHGLDVVRRFRGLSTVPVLILSGSTEESRKVQALEAGADDYLDKPFGVEELGARLRALLRRSGAAEGDPAGARPAVLDLGRLVVDLGARTVVVDGDPVHLTPTEWRLLEELAAHPGRLLTHRWLLARVWEEGRGEESRAALRTHVRSLRAKLGDPAERPTYVATESGAGYRWIAEPPDAAGAATVEDAPGEVPDTRALVHDLNNALTALQLGVHLAQGRLERSSLDDEERRAVLAPLDHLDATLARAGRLAVALEHRAIGEQTARGD